MQAFRDAGLTGDMDHQGRSLKSQFKLAGKMGAALVAVLGPDELANGAVTIRNMRAHREREVEIAVLKNFLSCFGGEPYGAPIPNIDDVFGRLEVE